MESVPYDSCSAATVQHPCDEILTGLEGAIRAALEHPAVAAHARSWLKEVHRIQVEVRGEMTLSAISDQVALAFRLAPDDLTGRKRDQRTAFARQVGIYLARKLSGKTYPEIGLHYRRDHSTCIFAFQQISQRIEREAGFRAFVGNLEATITGTVPVRAAA